MFIVKENDYSLLEYTQFLFYYYYFYFLFIYFFFLSFLKTLSFVDWFLGLRGNLSRVSYKLVSDRRTCKLQKWTVGPWLASSLEPLAHRGNVASLSLFYVGITMVAVHQNLLICSQGLILKEGLLIFLIECMILLSSFLDVTRMFMSIVYFLA